MPTPPFGNAIPYNSPINLNGLDLENAKLHMVPGDVVSPEEGQVWYNYLSHLPRLRVASTIQTLLTDLTTLNQIAAPVGSVNMNSQKITGMLDPTNPQDAATKNYADSIVSGLDVKASVRAATTGALPNTPAYANGTLGVGATLTSATNAAFPALDGVSLIVGDRVLVKTQVSLLQNGIYTLTTAGSGSVQWVLTRATDADQAAEVTPGMFTFVEEGTTLTHSGWILTSTGTTTMGTTALPFTQFSAAGQLTDDGSSILISAGVVSIRTTWPGQAAITTVGTIGTGTWQGTAVAVGFGGTGAATAAGARTNLNVPQRGVAATIGDGSTTSIAVNHGLGTLDVIVQVYVLSSGESEYPDIVRTNTNTVTLNFTTAPNTNTLRVVIIPVS